MSAKTKKISGRGTPVQSSGVASSRAGTSTPVPRASSPLSPTRLTRWQEKADLQNLNDRLATYIDRVRNLENENSRLVLEIQSSQETTTREVSNIKTIYENELSDARKLLDETSREKAKMEMDVKRLWEENDDLKTRLDKKLKELASAENNARLYESRYAELTGKHNSLRNDNKKAHDEIKDLEAELDRLRKQLDELRKHLEDETLARVDLENTVQSLREELTFKDQIHSQELNETRTRRQVEINEIDGRLSEQYEAKLQQSLQELRDQYEGQIRANRDEIELLYENKIKNLQNAALRNSNTVSSTAEELRMTRGKIDSMSARISELEGANATLNSRIRDLEKVIEAERIRHSEEVALLEGELQRMRDEMQQQLQEYQDLMDIKVSLDLEIAAYDKLLKGEEFRLNITPSKSANTSSLSQSQTSRSGRVTPGRRTPSRLVGGTGSISVKRKRTEVEESEESNLAEFVLASTAKGDIEICEVDAEGRFVKLKNKSDREKQLGGWQLVRVAGDNETIFKFHRSVKIDGNSVITIWSSDTGVNHEPPSNIVMKQQKWFVSDNMKTGLINAEGEEIASLERVKKQLMSHTIRHREHLPGSSHGREEIYHQQVRSSSNASPSGDDLQGGESCFLM